MSNQPEHTLRWRKSSFSANGGANCVEVARVDDEIAVRNSNDPDGPVLRFTGSELAAFVAGCGAGEFDDLT
ncbi:MAG: DUF397 domain-containing protein [Actinomycetota bacterium]